MTLPGVTLLSSPSQPLGCQDPWSDPEVQPLSTCGSFSTRPAEVVPVKAPHVPSWWKSVRAEGEQGSCCREGGVNRLVSPGLLGGEKMLCSSGS